MASMANPKLSSASGSKPVSMGRRVAAPSGATKAAAAVAPTPSDAPLVVEKEAPVVNRFRTLGGETGFKNKKPFIPDEMRAMLATV